jgi:hypothetical protein
VSTTEKAISERSTVHSTFVIERTYLPSKPRASVRRMVRAGR